MHYSNYFNVQHSEFVKVGVFDGLIEKDVQLHVDAMLLRNCKIPEFKDAYNKFLNYFNDIVSLTSGMNDLRIKQRCYNEIIRRMNFPEIVSTGLGYSKSNTKGSGISGKLSKKLATSCIEIVQAGIKDPAFFTLLPFIEDGIGADRISDMTIHILLKEFLDYTQRVAIDLGINCSNIKYKGVRYKLPLINNIHYLFVPQSLLAHLPIARNYDDITAVCDYNQEMRRKVCKAIGINMAEFEKMSKQTRKERILANSHLLNELLAYCKKIDVLGYDFVSDDLLLYADIKMTELVTKLPIKLTQFVTSDDIDVMGVTREIIKQYKMMIEDNHMYWLLYNDNHKFRNEKAAQLLFYMMAHSYCMANNIDLSRECDPGVGELDFKLSNGFHKKVLIEIKKASSSSLLPSYVRQLPAYEKAERTVNSFYLVIKDKPSTNANITKLQNKKLEMENQGKTFPEIVIIDAIEKPSASKLR